MRLAALSVVRPRCCIAYRWENCFEIGERKRVCSSIPTICWYGWKCVWDM